MPVGKFNLLCILASRFLFLINCYIFWGKRSSHIFFYCLKALEVLASCQNQTTQHWDVRPTISMSQWMCLIPLNNVGAIYSQVNYSRVHFPGQASAYAGTWKQIRFSYHQTTPTPCGPANQPLRQPRRATPQPLPGDSCFLAPEYCSSSPSASSAVMGPALRDL